VAKTSKAISARETPMIRIVFRTVRWADLSQEMDLLNTNLMWDVRKALPVTLARKVTAGPGGENLNGNHQIFVGHGFSRAVTLPESLRL
jgi:hypothetical protein